VNSVFSLHVHAPKKMLHEPQLLCRFAAEGAVIDTGRSNDQTSNLQVADKPIAAAAINVFAAFYGNSRRTHSASRRMSLGRSFSDRQTPD
jgi:hypothetical protein